MRNVKVIRHKQKLDAVFVKVGGLDPDSDLLPLLARYLCVLVSGFIEESLRSLLSDHATNCSSPHVANFVLNKMRRFTNAKTEKILTIASEFKREWSDTLAQEITEEAKDAIDSVISIRHEIAHGKDAGISYGTISRYYGQIVKAIEKIEAVFDSYS